MQRDANGPLPPLETEAQIEAAMTAPSAALVAEVSRTQGDLIVLGAGGKMGPTLAELAAGAFRAAGRRDRVLAVSRFADGQILERLRDRGVTAVRCDLLDRDALARLPDAAQVVFMAGRKFGSSGAESLTWAMNTHMPALVAERYRNAELVVFSTGNVYPFSSTTGPGASESTVPEPLGEYAQSCLGRERIFEFFSEKYGTRVTTVRLNYAIDLRYGVLVDIAEKVLRRQTIDLSMGHVNVIWQGDANAYVLSSLRLAASPPTVLNVAGPEVLSVRKAARRFGELFGTKPIFKGRERSSALLSDATRCIQEFGPPSVSVDQMIRWIAHWLQAGGRTLIKPTHYEVRDGRF